MKRFSYPAVALIVLISACESKDKSKTETVQKDSSTSITPDSLPALSKEFNQPVTAKASDSVLFKFNYEKGKPYLVNMNFNMANVLPNGKSVNNAMRWAYIMEVVADNNKQKTVKTTYKKIEMDMEINEQKMNFSSDKTVDPLDLMQMPSRMFSIIKGKSFTMQVNESGDIVSVSGFDKIGDAMVKEMNLPVEMKTMMEARFKQQFNDHTVKEMFSQSFNIFPDKYVKPGDTWVKKIEADTVNRVATTTTYTIKDIRNGKIYLNSSSKLDLNNGKGSGTQTSKLIVDAKTGLVLEAKFDQKMKGAGTSTSSGTITGKPL
jgi:hypothetical protein